MAGEDFDTFYQRTARGMLARAIMLCGHRQDAQDAVNEAYLELFRAWERVQDFEYLEGWVYRVMVQRLWRTKGANGHQFRLVDNLTLPAQVSLDQIVMVREVLRLLDELPRAQRDSLLLSCQGLPQEQIAELLGIKRGAVAANVHRARRNLKRALGLEAPLAAFGELSAGNGLNSSLGSDQVTALVLATEFALEQAMTVPSWADRA